MIDKLEMFVALARERHFGRAAESLGVAQPTLSAAIRQLEASVGVMLVRRGSRYGGLTPEGERVLAWARRIVGDARAMREEVRAARGGLQGRLALAAIPTALGAASRLSAGFAAAHPGVRVSVVSATSAAILDGIEALTFDAGISYLDNEPLGRAATVPLYEERYALILREDHPLAGRASVGWGALAELRLCLLTPDMQNRRIVARHLAEAGLSVAPQVETNAITVLVAHVLAGGWATVLPRGAADLFLAHGPLAAVPLTDPDAGHLVGLVAPPREPQRPVVAALLQEAAGLVGR